MPIPLASHLAIELRFTVPELRGTAAASFVPTKKRILFFKEEKAEASGQVTERCAAVYRCSDAAYLLLNRVRGGKDLCEEGGIEKIHIDDAQQVGQ